MREIKIEPYLLGEDTYFRLTIGNDITMLTREEAIKLSLTLTTENEIFETPF